MKVLMSSNLEIVSEAIKKIFIDMFEIENVHTTKDINKIKKEELYKYDIVCINISKGEDYIEQIKYIKNNNKNLKIIVFDRYKSINTLKNIISLDVEGYVVDIEDKEEFHYIISKILRGGKFYESNFVKEIITPSNNHLISKREKEVIKQLVKGYDNLQIAKNLNITENTVKKHVTNILHKLKLKNRKEIITMKSLDI